MIDFGTMPVQASGQLRCRDAEASGARHGLRPRGGSSPGARGPGRARAAVRACRPSRPGSRRRLHARSARRRTSRRTTRTGSGCGPRGVLSGSASSRSVTRSSRSRACPKPPTTAWKSSAAQSREHCASSPDGSMSSSRLDVLADRTRVCQLFLPWMFIGRGAADRRCASSRTRPAATSRPRSRTPELADRDAGLDADAPRPRVPFERTLLMRDVSRHVLGVGRGVAVALAGAAQPTRSVLRCARERGRVSRAVERRRAVQLMALVAPPHAYTVRVAPSAACSDPASGERTTGCGA